MTSNTQNRLNGDDAEGIEEVRARAALLAGIEKLEREAVEALWRFPAHKRSGECDGAD